MINKVNTPRPTITKRDITKKTEGTTKKKIRMNMIIKTKVTTKTSLVNPSVKEGSGRVRTLTLGKRAARAIGTIIATEKRSNNWTL